VYRTLTTLATMGSLQRRLNIHSHRGLWFPLIRLISSSYRNVGTGLYSGHNTGPHLPLSLHQFTITPHLLITP
jgi:hypothetical protein